MNRPRSLVQIKHVSFLHQASSSAWARVCSGAWRSGHGDWGTTWASAGWTTPREGSELFAFSLEMKSYDSTSHCCKWLCELD